MFEIGSSLRQARQHRRLDVVDVERATRIRAKYLNALENEQFHVLPGEAYVRGFLRTYAEFLDLDGNLLVEEYNARFAPPEELPPIQPVTLAPPPAARVARPATALLVVAVFGTIAVWQLGFTSAERTQIPQARAAAPAVRPVVRKPAAPAAKPTRAVVRTPATLVVRAARGECWLAVRVGSPDGPIVFQRTIGRGSVVRFGLRKPLFVRLGAPWNTDVSVRGKRLPPFGRQVVSLRAG